MLATHHAAVRCALGGWHARSQQIRLSVTDSVVAEQLDDVPVFGLLLVDDGKLYGSEDTGETMVYTGLADATRVLAQVQASFPGNDVQLMPLYLGEVLTKAGALKPAITADTLDTEPRALPTLLVPSVEEKRAARHLRNEAAMARARPRPGAAGMLQAVPVFHMGSFKHPGDEADFFPFFFRMADADALWEQLGDGAPRPPLVATDLAALVDGLREADIAPATPMVCAPLDALEYVRARDQSSMANLATEDAGDDAKPKVDVPRDAFL